MQRRKCIALYCVLVLLLAFIWGNSALPRSQSAAESASVGGFLTPFLELFVGEGNVTDYLVRKLAHFCEYAALGAVLALLMQVKYGITPFYLRYSIFTGVSVAVVDEAIQLIAEGRGSQVEDVLLDSCGVVAGAIIVSLLCLLRRIIKGRKRVE